jgi:hypothetical protein
VEGNVPADWTLALVRGQRHNLLNHLQVVSGWLQLKQPDRAMEQLTQLIGRLTTEMEATRGVAPEVAVHMLNVMLDAELNGVTLRWQIDSAAVPSAQAWDEVRAALRERDRGDVTVCVTADGRVRAHSTTGLGKG